MGFKPGDISPIKNDKYSLRLYRFVRHPRFNICRDSLKVYRDKDGCLWIGRLDDGDWFYGARLMSVLCGVSSAGRIGAFPELVKTMKLRELKTFWQRYLKVGRCALDPKHEMSFVNGAGRWKREGQVRECQWCGQVQRMKMLREVIKHEVWSNQVKAAGK